MAYERQFEWENFLPRRKMFSRIERTDSHWLDRPNFFISKKFRPIFDFSNLMKNIYDDFHDKKCRRVHSRKTF